MQHKANYNTVTVTYLNSFVAEELYFQTYPVRERVSLWKTEMQVCFKYHLTNMHKGPSIFKPSNM